jgi:pyrroloquinoline quinone biosynthesis protein B
VELRLYGLPESAKRASRIQEYPGLDRDQRRWQSLVPDQCVSRSAPAKKVRRQPIEVDEAFEPTLPDGSPSGIEILPFAVSGKSAWYLEGKAHPAGRDGDGDTLGLRIGDKASGKYLYFLAACANVTSDLRTRLAGASAVFFDGTVWRDDELIAAGLGDKTGQGMGHIAMSGETGAIAALANLDVGRKIFLHINNSNPVLLRDSAERKTAEHAGWQIPSDGMEITL